MQENKTIWTLKEGLVLKEWVSKKPEAKISPIVFNILSRGGHTKKEIIEKWKQVRVSLGLPAEPPMTYDEAMDKVFIAVTQLVDASFRGIKEENEQLRKEITELRSRENSALPKAKMPEDKANCLECGKNFVPGEPCVEKHSQINDEPRFLAGYLCSACFSKETQGVRDGKEG